MIKPYQTKDVLMLCNQRCLSIFLEFYDQLAYLDVRTEAIWLWESYTVKAKLAEVGITLECHGRAIGSVIWASAAWGTDDTGDRFAPA